MTGVHGGIARQADEAGLGVLEVMVGVADKAPHRLWTLQAIPKTVVEIFDLDPQHAEPVRLPIGLPVGGGGAVERLRHDHEVIGLLHHIGEPWIGRTRTNLGGIDPVDATGAL